MADVKVTVEAEGVGKAGVRSSEFWLTVLAQVLGAILAAGVLPEESPWVRVAGVLLMILTQLGYTAGRSRVKAEGLKALQASLQGMPPEGGAA